MKYALTPPDTHKMKQPKPKISHSEKKVKQYRATCPICGFTFVGKSQLEVEKNYYHHYIFKHSQEEEDE